MNHQVLWYKYVLLGKNIKLQILVVDCTDNISNIVVMKY